MSNMSLKRSERTQQSFTTATNHQANFYKPIKPASVQSYTHTHTHTEMSQMVSNTFRDVKEQPGTDRWNEVNGNQEKTQTHTLAKDTPT